MEWVYLSPHFDDVALSCGGLVWEQTQAGDKVHIWTICAGEPTGGSLSSFASYKHDSWDVDEGAVVHRRQEDAASCAVLGADSRYFPIHDCIYRQDPDSGEFMYDTEESMWGPLQPGDGYLVAKLSGDINRELTTRVEIVCPLALGDHVDHRLTRAAAEALGHPLWYYADFPYVQKSVHQLEAIHQQGWRSEVMPVSNEGMTVWEEAVAAHASQISTFWPGVPEMRLALRDYRREAGGLRLWQAPTVQPA